MTDPAFVAAGYLVVVGGVVLYAVALRRRIARAVARNRAVHAYAAMSDEVEPGAADRRAQQ